MQRPLLAHVVTASVPKPKDEYIQLTPKINRLPPRTARGGSNKELAANSDKSLASSLSNAKKRKEDGTDDNNVKRILKKKKPIRAAKNHQTLIFFSY